VNKIRYLKKELGAVHLLLSGKVEKKIGHDEGFGSGVVERDVLIGETGEVARRKCLSRTNGMQCRIFRAMP
jgi:hypothetical protein